MIKITLEALLYILLQHGIRCVPELHKDSTGDDIISFFVAHGYPNLGQTIYQSGDIRDEVINDKKHNNGRVILRYSVAERCVVACCSDLYSVIREIKINKKCII